MTRSLVYNLVSMCGFLLIGVFLFYVDMPEQLTNGPGRLLQLLCMTANGYWLGRHGYDVFRELKDSRDARIAKEKAAGETGPVGAAGRVGPLPTNPPLSLSRDQWLNWMLSQIGQHNARPNSQALSDTFSRRMGELANEVNTRRQAAAQVASQAAAQASVLATNPQVSMSVTVRPTDSQRAAVDGTYRMFTRDSISDSGPDRTLKPAPKPEESTAPRMLRPLPVDNEVQLLRHLMPKAEVGQLNWRHYIEQLPAAVGGATVASGASIVSDSWHAGFVAGILHMAKLLSQPISVPGAVSDADSTSNERRVLDRRKEPS